MLHFGWIICDTKTRTHTHSIQLYTSIRFRYLHIHIRLFAVLLNYLANADIMYLSRLFGAFHSFIKTRVDQIPFVNPILLTPIC